METERGYDAKTWERMASELSLLGLIIPEQHGGAGLGPVELGIVMEEMGRVLFCGPYLSTAVLGTAALLHAADDASKAKLLPAIASGKSIATLAFVEEHGRWDAESIAMRATRDGSKWKLSGVKDYVLDGAIADIVLVAARTDNGLGLFQVGWKVRARVPTDSRSDTKARSPLLFGYSGYVAIRKWRRDWSNPATSSHWAPRCLRRNR